ncbi:MAG TPA: hypothetical protein PLB96_03890 [Syntrophales bacterium]|nr:hypothetical protein [Syntrophales bacterium]HOI18238.1 hypothetical protein [Geobacteraceae bacterium]
MNRRFKWMVVYLVFSLVALSLNGCSDYPWEAGMTLVLKIETPSNDATVTTPTVKVSGRLVGSESKAATVKINNMDVPVKDATFSADVPLTEGKNVIKISAMGSGTSQEREVNVTYVPSKK